MLISFCSFSLFGSFGPLVSKKKKKEREFKLALISEASGRLSGRESKRSKSGISVHMTVGAGCGAHGGTSGQAYGKSNLRGKRALGGANNGGTLGRLTLD